MSRNNPQYRYEDVEIMDNGASSLGIQTDWMRYSSWLKYDRKLKSKAGSMSAMKSRFHTLNRYFEDKEFNRPNFLQFIEQELSRGISEATINKYTAAVKNIARHLGIKEFEDLTYFNETQEQVETLTWDEMDSIANVIVDYRLSKDGITPEEQNLRWKCIYRLMMETACRKGEALNLEWQDFFDGYVYFRDTKNGDNRAAPITQYLKGLMLTLPNTGSKIFGISDTSNLLLSDMNRRAKLLGIRKRVYPHIFRHSVCTQLVKSGASMAIIAKLTGHHDINTLLNRYSHLNLSDIVHMLSVHSFVWKKEMTIQNVSNELMKTVNLMLDNSGFSTSITQDDNSFTITVSRSKQQH